MVIRSTGENAYFAASNSIRGFFSYYDEIFNAARKDFENEAAAQYCKYYDLIPFAGSDNHKAGRRVKFGGIATDKPLESLQEFIDLFLARKTKPFIKDENGVRVL